VTAAQPLSLKKPAIVVVWFPNQRRDDYGRDPRTDCIGAEECKKVAHTDLR
jgi:hypothetical protein